MSEQRETQRRRVCFGGRIVHERVLSDTACTLRDLSCGGARLRVGGTVPLPDRFALVIPCRDATHRVEVVWRRGDETGVRFLFEGSGDGAQEDRIAALQDSLRASRAEIAGLRERLAAVEPGARPPGEALH